MHQVDQTTEQMVRSVLAYAENRLRMDPVPLDKGTQPAADLYKALNGVIRDRGRVPDEVLGIYSSVIAPSIISADSPRFLGFIPAAPTKASLLFDMLVSCASIQGISWLEASGAIAAENTVLRVIADEAGLPESAGGCFVSGGSAGNLSALAVARETAKRRLGTDAAGRRLRWLSVPSAFLDHQHTESAGDERTGGGDHRSPTHRGGSQRCARRRSRCQRCRRGGLYVGNDKRRHHRRSGWGWGDREAARLVVPRRRRVRRLRDLRSIFTRKYTGIEQADSFILDPHKWLCPSCCALIYRASSREQLRKTRRTWTSSMSDGEDPTDYAYHLTRRARGLPLWFSLAVYGLDAYRGRSKPRSSSPERAAVMIKASPHLELIRA